MAKVTSKLQVTIPKALAAQYGIEPGDEIEFQPAGPQIRVVMKATAGQTRLSVAERLRLFDEARRRQRQLEKERPVRQRPDDDRGWTRSDLYAPEG